MDDQCARVKELEKVDQTSMYDEVKKKPNNNIATKKKDGTVAMDEEEVKKGGVSIYRSCLNTREEPVVLRGWRTHHIMRNEAEEAMSKMKGGRVLGGERIAVEGYRRFCCW